MSHSPTDSQILTDLNEKRAVFNAKDASTKCFYKSGLQLQNDSQNFNVRDQRNEVVLQKIKYHVKKSSHTKDNSMIERKREA